MVYVDGEDALGCGAGGGDGCTLPPFFLGTDFLAVSVDADLTMVVESTAAAATVGDGMGDLTEIAEVEGTPAAECDGGAGADVCCADG